VPALAAGNDKPAAQAQSTAGAANNNNNANTGSGDLVTATNPQSVLDALSASRTLCGFVAVTRSPDAVLPLLLLAAPAVDWAWAAGLSLPAASAGTAEASKSADARTDSASFIC
jgi:threonine/homoserine/homoserine lactone efflux protein